MTILDHTRTLPLTVRTDWRENAACRGDDPEIFFPVGHDWNSPANKQRARQAKAVCAVCPLWVRAACRAEAVEIEDAWAIRDGLTPDERNPREAR